MGARTPGFFSHKRPPRSGFGDMEGGMMKPQGSGPPPVHTHTHTRGHACTHMHTHTCALVTSLGVPVPARGDSPSSALGTPRPDRAVVAANPVAATSALGHGVQPVRGHSDRPTWLGTQWPSQGASPRGDMPCALPALPRETGAQRDSGVSVMPPRPLGTHPSPLGDTHGCQSPRAPRERWEGKGGLSLPKTHFTGEPAGHEAPVTPA